MLDDADLQEIGIQNAADRQKLIASAQQLPAVQPINKLKGTEKFPSSVAEWLKSLNLLEYSENFINNNITDMDRALKLWEVELNTVSCHLQICMLFSNLIFILFLMHFILL